RDSLAPVRDARDVDEDGSVATRDCRDRPMSVRPQTRTLAFATDPPPRPRTRAVGPPEAGLWIAGYDSEADRARRARLRGRFDPGARPGRWDAARDGGFEHGTVPQPKMGSQNPRPRGWAAHSRVVPVRRHSGVRPGAMVEEPSARLRSDPPR